MSYFTSQNAPKTQGFHPFLQTSIIRKQRNPLIICTQRKPPKLHYFRKRKGSCKKNRFSEHMNQTKIITSYTFVHKPYTARKWGKEHTIKPIVPRYV